ncbi:MAG: UDP-N-acetylmuramoyl-tripeptide--D-alanyl-D-alanine ligase [Phycisphaerales bacterium JB037]
MNTPPNAGAPAANHATPVPLTELGAALINRVGGRWLVEPGAGAIARGAAIDSREVSPGQVFFAFAGERVDGHAFVARALANGAAAAVVTRDRAPDGNAWSGGPVLRVESSELALVESARLVRTKLGATVVGITGSAGKTTTTRLLASVLREVGATSASIKSHNNRLGVSLTILNARADARFLVAEIGTSGPGEIAELADLARPDAAVITSIGRAHLEKLGSVAGVAREKASLFRALRDGSPAVFPAGIGVLEEELARDGTAGRLALVRVGLAGSDASGGPGELRGIEVGGSGVSFELADGARFASPVAGVHNAMNAALAAVLARRLGGRHDAIRRGLASPELPPMRAQVEKIAGLTLINDCYNANPESVLAALAVLADRAGGRATAAVLGDMLELGEQTDTAHDEVVRAAAARGVGRLILIGPAMAKAGDRLAAGLGDGVGRVEIVRCPSTDDASIAEAAGRLERGWVVLVKGSRGLRLERVRALLAERGELSTIVTADRARAPMVDRSHG